MRRLIVTADDFGAAVEVNEAVERGHREGVLTAASLMVTGDAAADAVRRAVAMPALGIGLHLVLVEGRPALPPAAIPDLVDGNGNFSSAMARTGFAIFARPGVRRQLRAEITAQFERFAATGLRLDHVNAHKHFHLHPTIAGAILTIGKRYGMAAMRAPVEPRAILRAIEPGSTGFSERLAGLWAQRLARRLRAAGLAVPDQVFGPAWSGAMGAERLAALVARLPAGLSEIYLHPAMRDDYPGHAPGYQYREEYRALIDPAVRRAAQAGDIALGSFASLGGRA